VCTGLAEVYVSGCTFQREKSDVLVVENATRRVRITAHPAGTMSDSVCMYVNISKQLYFVLL